MTTLTTYTLQILAPGMESERPPFRWPEMDKRVLANLPAMIESAEEDFTDMLPEGYTVKIEKAL